MCGGGGGAFTHTLVPLCCDVPHKIVYNLDIDNVKWLSVEPVTDMMSSKPNITGYNYSCGVHAAKVRQCCKDSLGWTLNLSLSGEHPFKNEVAFKMFWPLCQEKWSEPTCRCVHERVFRFS